MLLAIDYAFVITIDKSGAGRNFVIDTFKDMTDSDPKQFLFILTL